MRAWNQAKAHGINQNDRHFVCSVKLAQGSHNVTDEDLRLLRYAFRGVSVPLIIPDNTGIRFSLQSVFCLAYLLLREVA